MRKLKLQMSKRNAIFGVLTLCVIALLSIFSGGLFGLAAVGSVALAVAAPIALTDKEQAIVDLMKSDLQKEAEKLGKGYITADAFASTFNDQFIKAMAAFDFNAEKVKQVTDAVEAKLKEFDLSANASFLEVQQKMEVLEQNKPKMSIKKSTYDSLVAVKDDLDGLIKGLKSEVSIDINAANVTRSSVDGNDNAELIPGIGQLATRTLPMRSLCRAIPMNGMDDNGYVRWLDWDADTIVRAAATVAEGGTFAESTAAWKQNSLQLKKIGDSIPVTEEVLEDLQSFAAELEMFLETNVQIVEDVQLLRGDGTGSNMKGLLTSISEFPYATYSGTIQDASIFDLIIKNIEDITTTGGNKYLPNFVVMPSALITSMTLKKDGNNNYVLPPFMVKNTNGQMTIANVAIVEENGFTDSNQMAIGDSRYMRLYYKAGIVLSRGTVSTQFTADMITLKARMRELFVIRDADQGGFRKVSNVSTAISSLNEVTPG
jgi:HK97 family phage major capsid protein